MKTRIPSGEKDVTRKLKPIDFEKALEELERLVERMEQGELSLEESLRTYERGIELSRRCQRALEQAEQRVRVLAEDQDRGGEPAPAESSEEQP